MKNKSVVVIGGGTGTYTVLKGLSQYSAEFNLTAIVSMADSGGSTGRLRDELGLLPVGDVRMALAALADEGDGHEGMLRELFLYRFDRGTGLSGHNFGNLFLAALTDIVGSEAEAVRVASALLRVRGVVLPVTTSQATLRATYHNGVTVLGESNIDDPVPALQGELIKELSLVPEVPVYPEVLMALAQADLIVIGPGDLYTSLLANFVVSNMALAVRESQAQVAYITNLMERPGQTVGMTHADCVREIAQYIGRTPDVVLVNSSPLPVAVIERYWRDESVRPIVDDLQSDQYNVIRRPLLSLDTPPASQADLVRRSLLRHDPQALANSLREIIYS